MREERKQLKRDAQPFITAVASMIGPFALERAKIIHKQRKFWGTEPPTEKCLSCSFLALAASVFEAFDKVDHREGGGAHHEAYADHREGVSTVDRAYQWHDQREKD